jgi:hypothetical protein
MACPVHEAGGTAAGERQTCFGAIVRNERPLWTAFHDTEPLPAYTDLSHEGATLELALLPMWSHQVPLLPGERHIPFDGGRCTNTMDTGYQLVDAT